MTAAATTSKDLKINSTDWQSTACTLHDRFKKLLELEEWADCKFLVGSEEPRTEISCHKLLLSAASPVFEAMFFGGLAVKKDEPIILPDIEPEHFRLFIKYIYTDSLSLTNIEVAEGILYAAKKYLIPHLADRCTEYLEENLDQDLLETLRIADRSMEVQLQRYCFHMLCQIDPLQWSESDMLHLGALSTHTLLTLLDIIPLPDNELQAFWFLVQWAGSICKVKNMEVTCVNKRRVIDEYSMLQRIRCRRLDPDELQEIRESGILSDKECNQIEMCILNIPFTGSDGVTTRPWVPSGFSSLETPRSKTLTKEQTYVRSVLSYRTKWLYGGIVKCEFESNSKGLLTGFSISTRLPYEETNRRTDSKYEESFSISITDSKNELLYSNEYKNPETEYNSTLKILLNQSVWFEPNHVYCIRVKTERGQYPSYELSDVIFKDFERFLFRESYVYLQDRIGDSDIGCTSGLITALHCKKIKCAIPDTNW